MQEHPDTTEEPEDLLETFGVNGEGLPEKVFSLRQKLYRKAKREPMYKKPKGLTWWVHLQRLGWTPLQKRPVKA